MSFQYKILRVVQGSVLLILCLVFTEQSFAQLGSYSNRKSFVIESDSVRGSSDLTNYPLLFNTTLPPADVENANGYDIAFTSSDGTTQLDHEIEFYNSTTGEVIAWVNIPSISPIIDTQFYVYYGDATITTSQDAATTWDSDYVLVMHMNGPDNGTETDRSQYGNNGTTNGNESSSIDTVNAFIGYGRDFERTFDQYIQIPDDPTLDITGNITMSFWFSREDQQPDFIGKGQNASYEATSRGTMRSRFNKNGANTLTTSADFTINTPTFVYMNYVQTSTGMRIYQNDTLVASNSNVTAFSANNDPLYISNPSDEIDGIMDEVRISNIARSEDWIFTEHSNHRYPSTFIVETPDVPVIENIETTKETYNAGGAAVFITASTTVNSHPTITDLDSVIVQVTGNFEVGDILDYTGGVLTESFTSNTGKIKLEGTQSLSIYESAIRAITYESSLMSPSSLTRTISITAYSGSDPTSTLTRDFDIVTVLTGLDDAGTPVFYLNALDLDGNGTLDSLEASTPLNNSAISTWADRTTNNFDFTSGTDAIYDSLAFGERGAVFYVPNDILTKTTETLIDNTNFTEKTFAMIFRTGSDVSGFQVIYEQSGANRGYNFSIYNDSVYAHAYSRSDGDWGPSNTERDYAISLGVAEPNTTYYLYAYHDNNIWAAQVNGGAFTQIDQIGELDAQAQTSGLGGSSGNTRQPVDFGSTTGFFSGQIAEIATWNELLTAGQITSINNYFEENWGNTAPVLSAIEGTNIDFTEGDPDTLITTAILVTDSDSHNNLDSAQVRISANYQLGEDVLTFSKVGNISGNFNASTGILSLSGSDTKSNYQDALRSVRYQNITANPTASTRQVDFIVYDWDDSSSVVSRSINVIDVDISPTLSSIETDTLDFSEGDAATIVSNTITINDFDSPVLTGATISISNNFILGEDELAFTDFGTITGNWNSSTGILSLSGSDDLADYQTALRSITFENTSSNPVELTRDISFNVTDGVNTSTTVLRRVDVIAGNSAPILSSIETTSLPYEDIEVVITNSIVVSDPDDTFLDSALVIISENFKPAEDTLIYSSLFGITGTWNGTDGVLKLEGNNLISDYQSALRSVKYENLATIASGPERVISFLVSDGDLKSDTTKRVIDVSPVETISNLEVWLRADAGLDEADGVAIDTWADQSGNGNDYTAIAQGVSTPTFVANSATLNGQPSVNFVGDGDYFEDADGENYINSSTEFSLFVVYKSNAINTDRGLFIGINPNETDEALTIRYDADGANNGGSFTNVVKTGILGNTAANQLESFSDIQTTDAQIISLQWKSDELYDLYVDGILNNPSSAGAPPSGTITTTTTAILGKGGKDTSGESWLGEIAEFIYYSKSLSEVERESVEDYLAEKYDLPIRKITPATGGDEISADNTNSTFTSLSGPFIQEGFFQELTFGGTIVLNAPSGYEWNTSGSYGVTVTPAFGGSTDLDASFTSVTASQLTFTIDDTSRSTSSPGQLEFTGLEIRPTTGVLPNTGTLTNTGSTGQGGDTNYGTITMIAGAQDSLSFVQQPSATNIDSTISPPVRVQIVDQFGNEVEQSGVNISVSQSSGTPTLSGMLTESTNAVGIAEFDSLIFNSIGTKELEATSSGLKTDTSSTFDIVNAGTLTGFLVERAPSGTISSKFAGQTFNIALTALDGTSTPITDFNGTVVVSSGCTIGTGQGTSPNFTSGFLTSLTVSITSVGVCDITVTNSTGSETGTSNSFTVTPGSADTTNSTITALPTVIVNDQVSQSVLTVQLVDEFGNNLTSGGNTVVLSATDGTLTLGGAGAQDLGDGTYTDTLTSSSSQVVSTITGTIDGNPIDDNAIVEFAQFNNIWQSQLGSVADASNWDDPANWSSGSVPAPGDIILIPSNPSVGNEFPVLTQTGTTFTSLSMEPSASITISGGINVTVLNDLSGGSVLGTTSDSLTVGGDILDLSTINVGTVILNGSTAQTITNPHSYLTLEINNPSSLTIEQNLTISDTLKLTSGTLIVPSGVSVLAEDIVYGTGNFNFNRTITGDTGWRILSSPVSSTYGDFLDGTLTQGFTGSTLGNAALDSLQPNVLTYLESYAINANGGPATDNQRYRTPSDQSDALVAGQGIFVFFFGDIAADARYNDPLPDTLSVTGQEFFTSGKEVDFGVTYTVDADSGWNLVGNPFGATIDWDDASNWTKTNIESTIYLWDPSANSGNGEYLTWNGSTGTLGDGLIPAFQGFWIKANAASPELKVTTAAKTSGGNFLRKTADSVFQDPPTFSLKLTSNGLEKRTVFMFSENALTTKDTYDAFELTPFSDTRLEIYSTLSDGTPLAINSLPSQLTNRYLIPIFINGFEQGLPISSTFELLAVNMNDIPDDWLLLLIDEVTGEEIDLRIQESYDFFHTSSSSFKVANPLSIPELIQKSSNNHRFTLKITTEEIESNIPQTIFLDQNYPNPFNPSTTIQYGLDVDSNVQLEVFDILGRRVKTLVSEQQVAGLYTLNFDASTLASGVYIYRLTTDNQVKTQKMLLIK